MKELRFSQSTANGMLNGVLRIINKELFFKYNDHTYAQQAIESFRKKGAKIDFGEGKKWIKVDIFGDHDAVKLGNYEIDFNNDSPEEIESRLADFYEEQYTKMGFFVDRD